MMSYWTAEEIKKRLENDYVIYVKYIRLNTGEMRFIDHLKDHSSSVDKEKDTTVSAGTLKIKKDKGFYIDSVGSFTLGISTAKCLQDDEEVLEKVLGMKYVNSYDM